MSEIMWAIKHDELGFYCGTYLTRSAAIKDHAETRRGFGDERSVKQLWSCCRRNGDSAVRVELTEVLS